MGDEIHKLPKWKNILKAVFDQTGDRFHFIVTGSAKLNLLKRAGDSLAGRYFTFHLLPLTVREVRGVVDHAPKVPETAESFVDFVACQLRARLSLWNDASGEVFDLFYVRDRQKRETDFLVLRQGRPWLLAEAKLGDGPVDAHHLRAADALGGIPVVQLCRQPGVAALQRKRVYRASAERLFA